MTSTSRDAETSPSVRRVIVLAIPLAVVVGLFGVSFGVVAAATPAMGGVAAVVMSATVFAGSAQFAAISVLAAGGQPIAAIVAAVLLNLRYLAIGASVAGSMRGGRLRRLLTAQLIVDESWAVSARPRGRFDMRVLVGAGLLLWLAWVLGTAIGAVGGQAIGDPGRLGIDGAFPALFLAIVVPQLRTRRARTAAVVGAVISIALVPVTPAGVPIIAAASAALIGLERR
jgi:4-azaleucine resistance transporter AzlC